MLKKLFFFMFALLAIIPLRAEDSFIIHGQIGAANDNWSDVITLVSDNTGKYYADRYFHPGNFGIKQWDGQKQIMWYNLDGKGDNGEQNGGETKVDVASDALDVIDGTHQIHLNKEGAYRFVFDKQNLTVGFYEIDESTVSYCIHGQITGNIDWEDIELTYNENDKTWQTTKSFVSGSFGLKRLAENGEQLNWLNFSGKADNGDESLHNKSVSIADDQNGKLEQDGQNFNLNEGGEFTFVYNPATNTLGFYKDYNPGEKPDPVDPDPIDPDPVDPTITPLYLLHESMYSGDWGGTGMPQQMTYDENTRTYSIHVNDGGAFGLSRTDLNGQANDWIFWKDDYLLRPRTVKTDGGLKTVQTSFVHFNEPDFYNAEHGAKPGTNRKEYENFDPENNDNFRTHTAGTIKVKYDKESGLAKIWYVPDTYPDLYIMGAIIAPAGDTQGDKSNQWRLAKTMTKYKLDGKETGLYYYDLGINGNELFNLNSYIATPNKDGDQIDEIGHFNFSLAGTDPEGILPWDNDFWADPFAPLGGGMGDLDRNGTPFQYVYRDSDPARDYVDGGWTSTNYVFKERCRVWVDVKRQLVWVELPDKKLEEGEVMFTFWDKRGDKYPKDQYNYLRWWDSNLDDNTKYSVELVVYEDNDPSKSEKASYSLQIEEDNPWTTSVHSVNGVTDGIYHGISTTSLGQDLVNAAKELAKKLVGADGDFKNYLWVRIKDINSEEGHYGKDNNVIVRPYVQGAVYTQAIKDGELDNTPYGDITEGEMNVTMTPDLRVIPNATEAQRMTGGFDNETTIVYPAVNQYQTVINFNDPFTVEGDVKFNKTYSIQGYVGDTKFSTTDETGSMTQIRLTGVNHTDETLNDFDKIFVEINYESDGMIFSRSYERVLPVFDWKDDVDEEAKPSYFELPVMNYGIDSNDELTKEAFGFIRTTGHDDEGDGKVDGGHWTVDLILHKEFKFRDQMINNRAAYIRYTVENLKVNGEDYNGECSSEHGLLADDVFASQNGVPLTWHLNDQTNALSQDLWYQEAFVNQQLDIELRHVLCAESKEELSGEVTGKVVYELIVPIADEVKAYFEPTPDEAKLAKRKISSLSNDDTNGPQVDEYVPGYEYDPEDDSKNGYSGSLSAPSDDTEDNIENIYKDEFVFKYTYEERNAQLSGVEDVAIEPSEDAEEYEYFNLQGIRLNSDILTPGIYIRRSSNGVSTKIYVK